MGFTTRYIFKQLFWSTFIVAAILSMAIWLSQSLRVIDLIIYKSASLATFVYMMLFLFPELIAVVLPVAMLISVLFIYYRLFADHEIIIMRSIGLSDLKLVQPAIYLSFIVISLLYAINQYVLPVSFRHFKDIEHAIRHQSATLSLQPGTFSTVNDITIFVGGKDSNGSLKGLLVHDAHDLDKAFSLIATRGTLEQTPEGLELKLMEGTRQQFNKSRDIPESVHFNLYQARIIEPNQTLQARTPKPFELFTNDLLNPKGVDPNSSVGRKMRAEGHKRILLPWCTLAFALICIAVFLRGDFNRRRQSPKILVAVGICLAVQLTPISLINLSAKKDYMILLSYFFVGGAIILSLLSLLNISFKRPSQEVTSP